MPAFSWAEEHGKDLGWPPSLPEASFSVLKLDPKEVQVVGKASLAPSCQRLWIPELKNAEECLQGYLPSFPWVGLFSAKRGKPSSVWFRQPHSS